MKFIVDSLPYYYDDCPYEYCCHSSIDGCPRYWDKYFVTSEDNPRECEWLKEYDTINKNSDDAIGFYIAREEYNNNRKEMNED